MNYKIAKRIILD